MVAFGEKNNSSALQRLSAFNGVVNLDQRVEETVRVCRWRLAGSPILSIRPVTPNGYRQICDFANPP